MEDKELHYIVSVNFLIGLFCCDMDNGLLKIGLSDYNGVSSCYKQRNNKMAIMALRM